MIDGEPWQDRVPEVVIAAVAEIDGVARLRRIAETDGEPDDSGTGEGSAE